MNKLDDIEGIKVRGRNMNNLRYADDTVLIADSAEKLPVLVNRLIEESTNKNMKVNISKTQV